MEIYLQIKKGEVKKIKIKKKDLRLYKRLKRYKNSWLYQKKDSRKYKKDKRKRKERKKKEKFPKWFSESEKKLDEKAKREEVIERIKNIGKKENVTALEKRLIEFPNKFEEINRKLMAQTINPQGIILTDNKKYNSFKEINSAKFGIYRDIILKNVGKEKLINSIYRNRRIILRDGMVIKIRCFGNVNSRIKGVRYLGTFETTGILVEEVGQIESEIMYYNGYMEELEPILRRLVKSKGGKGLKLIENNTKGTSVNVNNIQLEFDYA